MPPREQFVPDQLVGTRVSLTLSGLPTALEGTVFTYCPEENTIVLLQGLHRDRHTVKVINLQAIQAFRLLPELEGEKLPLSAKAGAVLPALRDTETLPRALAKKVGDAEKSRRYGLGPNGKSEWAGTGVDVSIVSIAGFDSFDHLQRTYPTAYWSADANHLSIAGDATAPKQPVIVVPPHMMVCSGADGTWTNPVVKRITDVAAGAPGSQAAHQSDEFVKRVGAALQTGANTAAAAASTS